MVVPTESGFKAPLRGRLNEYLYAHIVGVKNKHQKKYFYIIFYFGLFMGLIVLFFLAHFMGFKDLWSVIYTFLLYL